LLAVVDLLLFHLGPLRLKYVERVFVEFVQILLVRNRSHSLARFSSGDSAEGSGVFTFRTPRDVVDVRKLGEKAKSTKRRLQKNDQRKYGINIKYVDV
jgi:hypothetical protein